MDISHPISPDMLKQILSYDCIDGSLIWKIRPLEMFSSSSYAGKGSRPASWSCNKWNSRHAGNLALTADNGFGYKVGRIFGKKYRAHNVAWALHYGYWPSGVIDHINCKPHDNRIDNLRDVSANQNARNRRLGVNNTSGRKGVSYYKARAKWVASIRCEGKYIHLGYYDNLEDASMAYDLASQKYHGNYGKTNK